MTVGPVAFLDFEGREGVEAGSEEWEGQGMLGRKLGP